MSFGLRSPFGALVGSLFLVLTGCGRTPFVGPKPGQRQTSAGGAAGAGDGGGMGGALPTNRGGAAGVAGFPPAAGGGIIFLPPLETCGDLKLDPGEECDDGNLEGGDGCSAGCRVERDFECIPFDTCRALVSCGDGVVAGREECDTGNVGSLGCNNCFRDSGWICRSAGTECEPLCGDGFVLGNEACDDGSTLSGDGCSPTCLAEWGASCDLAGCRPPVCGNGIVEAGESCDLGSANGLSVINGTGCSAECLVEASCRDQNGVTVACATTCGDGHIDPGEGCDDGNRQDVDGCSSTCVAEAGFSCVTVTEPALPSCGEAYPLCRRAQFVFRDFDGEHEATGHPDFQFLGANGRQCIPDASGAPDPAPITDAECWTTDSTELCQGLVAGGLGADGTPVLGADTTCACRFTDHANTGILPSTNQCTGRLDNLVPRVETTVGAIQDAQSFADWFHHSETHPSIVQSLSLFLEAPSRYVWSSGLTIETDLSAGDGASLTSGFFPLYGEDAPTVCNIWPYWVDNPSCVAGLGGPVEYEWYAAGNGGQGVPTYDVQGFPRNFYFTTELRTQFAFSGSERFDFRGNDDLWVFVNGVLVLDMGGTHERLEGTFDLSTDPPAWTVSRYDDLTGAFASVASGVAPVLGLVAGARYELAMFHAQRHPRESDFELGLQGFNVNRSVCEPSCGDGLVLGDEQCDYGSANDDAAYGGCRTDCTYGPYCGDGEQDPLEDCDVGFANTTAYGAPGCTAACEPTPYCGDGFVDGAYGEQCDDGVSNGFTACSTSCFVIIR